MKTKRFHALLALLLMAGGVTMQAQEQRQINLFASQKAQESAPMQAPTVVSAVEEWLFYAEEYGDNLAYIPEGIPFSWAVSFPPERLQAYDGFTMTQVALWENEWNIGNLMLRVCYGNAYMPLTVMDEQVVVPENLVGLVEIQLLRPVEIDASKHLWIVFSELTATETYSAAFAENMVDPDPNARWVQMEENKWADAAMYGPWDRVQFLIWGFVTNDPWGADDPISLTTSSVYPNPAKDKVTITGLEPVEVQLYNALGQLMKTVRNANEINVSDLPEGIYLLRITDTDGRYHAKTLVRSW